MLGFLALAGLTGVVVAVPLMVHYSRTPCPGCGTRGSIGWLHAKSDGSRDFRFKDNYRRCRQCEWTPGDLKKTDQPRAAAAPAPMNGRAWVENELRKVQELAAAEHRQRDLEKAERSIVWLLKYVALADRRFAEGERQALTGHIRRLFPAERQARLVEWADQLKPESITDLHSHLDGFVALPRADRGALFADLEAMAVADGKATKAEKDRLAEIRKGLGLDEA